MPVNRPPASGPVTGYAVYADGKKVTDVDSPTGDHALIDITKLVGINPQVVTVRTKSRDAQSADSMATPIPRKFSTNPSYKCLLFENLFNLTRKYLIKKKFCSLSLLCRATFILFLYFISTFIFLYTKTEKLTPQHLFNKIFANHTQNF